MAQLTHQVFITISDAKGMKSTATFHIPIATIPQDALDYADALVALYDPMTVAQIVSAGVTLNADISGVGAGAPQADAQEKGEYVFRSLNNFPFRVAISGFDENLVVANSQQLDTADLDMLAFIDGLITGVAVPSTAVIQATDSRGEDLLSLESALERFRRRPRVS